MLRGIRSIALACGLVLAPTGIAGATSVADGRTQLVVLPIPSMPMTLDRKPVGPRFVRVGDRGVLKVGDKTSPVQLTFTFKRKGNDLVGRLDAGKRKLVLKVNDEEKGVLPLEVTVGEKAQKFDFVDPAGADPIRIIWKMAVP